MERFACELQALRDPVGYFDSLACDHARDRDVHRGQHLDLTERQGLADPGVGRELGFSYTEVM